MKRILSMIMAILLLAGCEPETYLFVNESPIAFEESGGSQIIDVIANKEWQATTNGGWCKVSPATGVGSENSIRITVQCEPNTGYDERSCILTVVCADARKTVSITQSPKGAIVIDKIDYELSYEAQTLNVSILENTEYKVQVNADCQDWIQFAGTKGLVTSSFELLISENEKREREGTVYVTSFSDVIALKIKQTDGTINDKIPDPNFRQYCIENFDTNNDGLLSYKEAKKVSSIEVNTGIISTLEGIEYFSSLRYLNCSLVYNASSDGHYYYDGKEVYSLLKQLNISNNTALTYLGCVGNQLTSLDVSNNTALTTLRCDNNQLTSLDVSNNTALTTLWCDNNQLTSLDVSNNTALTTLYCYNNQLRTLDVSSNTALTRLYCYSNLLISLDVSNNTALTTLLCGSNKFTALEISNPAIIWLDCSENDQLTVLDVSKIEALSTLICNNNILSSLNVSNNKALESLNCSYNQLATLDVSQNVSIEVLNCNHNRLTSLDVKNNHMLKDLNCQSNQLSSLDVTENTELLNLAFGDNQLTSIDLSQNNALDHLYCWSNQLHSLDVSSNLMLSFVNCSYNPFFTLDLSKNLLLKTLYCHCSSLTDLYLSKEQVVSINVYDNTTVHYQ